MYLYLVSKRRADVIVDLHRFLLFFISIVAYSPTGKCYSCMYILINEVSIYAVQEPFRDQTKIKRD